MALRVPAAGQRFHMATLRGMVVADANPVLELLREGKPWRAGVTAASFNHRGSGQNVVFDDGSVRWLISPILSNGDCIWTPGSGRGDADLAPGSLPLNESDIFLAQ